MYNLVDLKDEKNIGEYFEKFYNESIFTWEGMEDNENNLKTIVDKLHLENPTIYTYTGKQMNEYYKLESFNIYPDDLIFVSIENYYNPVMKIKVGARWFDDIVDNNERYK